MSFWNESYASEDYKYGVSPNTFLVQQAHRLAPQSRVLVPGDGEGRNGVWLAKQGHQVTSVDGSSIGLEKARALADREGVSLELLHADLAGWSPLPGYYDAVVLTYVHLPPAIRAASHRRLASGLKPGGCLILEAFHPGQISLNSGGPKSLDMLYPLEMLRADFAGQLDEVFAWEGEVVLDEGTGHQGQAQIIRWVGLTTAKL